MNKNELITNLNKEHFAFWSTAINSPEPDPSINGKWSVAQNVEHTNLVLSQINKYLQLPKAAIKSNYGISERASTGNETFINTYKNALKNGAKATAPFIPALNPDINIGELIKKGKNLLEAFISNLQNWSEEEFDLYNCPHPVLGKTTAREILYFTIYHVQHHHEILKKCEMSLTQTAVYQIENTSLEDLNFIYWLFEEAIVYQKRNNYIGWNSYDKDFIKLDIKNKLQFKTVKGNVILSIFSICFSDALIWREKENGDAIYLHRIVVNPALKGQKQFEKILNWVVALANDKGFKYIRMDTWADNLRIIEYYKSYGFQFLENYTTPDSPELPHQHRNLKVALLEMKL